MAQDGIDGVDVRHPVFQDISLDCRFVLKVDACRLLLAAVLLFHFEVERSDAEDPHHCLSDGEEFTLQQTPTAKFDWDEEYVVERINLEVFD